MRTIFFLIIIFFSLEVYCQKAIQVTATANKTTSIIMPTKIIHVDLGLADPNLIGFQVEESVPHLLKIRVSPNLNITTNMLIVTEDNLVYSFELRYTDSLSHYVSIVKKEQASNYVHKPTSTTVDTNQTPIIANNSTATINDIEIFNRKSTLERTILISNGKIELELTNILYDKNKMYLVVFMKNKSNINYDIDFTNTYESNERNKKLSSSVKQDQQISHKILSDIKTLAAKDSKKMIIELPKFTLEANKNFVFEIYEKSGGRHLKLHLTNQEFINADRI